MIERKVRSLFYCIVIFLISASAVLADDRYWIASTDGNWNNSANWSTTSGGAGGSSVPGPSDIAKFDERGLGNAFANINVDVAGISIISGYTGTITQNPGITITVGSGGYSQNNGTFAGGDATVTIRGNLNLLGGTFTSTSGILGFGRQNVNLMHTFSGGTFNHNGGTLRFVEGVCDSAQTLIISMSLTLNNLDVIMEGDVPGCPGRDLTISGTLEVSGTLNYLARGIQGGTINARGPVIIGNPTGPTASLHTTGGTTNLRIVGTGSQTVTINPGAVTTGLTIDNPDAVVTVVNSAAIGDSFTMNTGTFNGGPSSLSFTTSYTQTSGTFTAPMGAMSLRSDVTNTLSGGTFNHNNGNLVFQSGGGGATNSNLTINMGTTGNVTIGGNNQFNVLTNTSTGAGSLTLAGSNTISELRFGARSTTLLGANQTTTMLTSLGTFGQLAVLRSSAAGVQRTLSASTANVNFMDVRDMIAYGTASPFRTVHGLDSGNNVNWIFEERCVLPTSGLIGWWPGDGNANDIIGGNHGTLHNGAAFAVGKVGQAFRLDGVDDFVEVPDSPSLDIQNAFTMEVWVMPERQALMRILQRVTPDTVGINLLTDTTGTRYRFNIDDGPTDYDVFSTTPLSVGNFQHIACTFDGSTMRLYVNGTLEATTSASPHPDINAPLHFSHNDIPFKGLIDEVSIYNRALTASEILAVFLAGSTGKCRPPETSITSAVDGAGSGLENGGSTTSRSITFTFAGTDDVGVTGFECSLDGSAFSACTSPQNYTGLSLGAHTFRVRARDSEGNVDPTPATFTWTIDEVSLPPVANAGTDQTVKNTSPAGAVVTLNGSASTDPNNNIARYEWFENASLIATGATTSVTFPVGVHPITLKVTDSTGLSSTDDVRVEVQYAGVVFSPASYVLTVDREYDQQRTLFLYNPDPLARTAFVRDNGSLPPDLLGTGFTGDGIESRPVTLQPGETRAVIYSIFAQDTTQRNYQYTVECVTRDTAFVNTAAVQLNVLEPRVQLRLDFLGEDPLTLAKNYRVTNLGQDVTNTLRVYLDDRLAQEAFILPVINHARLEPGQSIDFQVIPQFRDGWSGAQGTLFASGSHTVNLPVSWTLPNGQQAFLVNLDHPKLVFNLKDFYCSNRPNIATPFWLPWVTQQAVETPHRFVYGKLQVKFTPVNAIPHNTDIRLNSFPVASFLNTVPAGTFAFDITAGQLVKPLVVSTSAQNFVQIDSSGTAGHYIQMTDIRVTIALSDLSFYMIGTDAGNALSRAQALPFIFPNSTTLDVQIQTPQNGQMIQGGATVPLQVLVTNGTATPQPQNIMDFVRAHITLPTGTTSIELFGTGNGIFSGNWNTPSVGGTVVGTMTVEAKNSRTFDISGTITVTLEPLSTPIDVNITAPSSGMTVSGTTTVAWNIIGTTGTASTNAYFSTSSTGPWTLITVSGPVTGLTAGTSWDTTQVFNDVYYIRVLSTIQDGGAFFTREDNVSVTVNNTNINRARIEFPPDGAYVKGSLDIGGTAYSTTAGQTYSLSINGTSIPPFFPTATVRNGLLAQFDTRTVADGTYSLTLQLDGTGVSHAITVTVDNTPPAANISVPTAGSTVMPGPGGTFSVTGTATDAHLREYSIWVTTQGTSTPVTLIAVETPVSDGLLANWVLNPAVYPAGTYTMTLFVRDLADNTNTFVVGTFTLVYDTTPPVTTIDSAIDGNGVNVPVNGCTSSTSITFTFTGTDTGGIDHFECRLDGGTFTVCTSPHILTFLPVGTHTFQVQAVDTAGNVDLTPATHTWTVDTTGPTVTNVTVTPFVTCGDTTVTGTATDTLCVIRRAEYFIDRDPGEGNGTPMLASDGLFDSRIEGLTGTITVGAIQLLTEGTHTVFVRARDDAMNWGLAGTATFIVDCLPLTATPRGFFPPNVNTTFAADVDNPIPYLTISEPATVTMTIFQVGNLTPIRTFPAATFTTAGTFRFPANGWDGISDGGALLTAGTYTYSMTAQDFTGTYAVCGTSTIISSDGACFGTHTVAGPCGGPTTQSTQIRQNKIVVAPLTVTPGSFDPDTGTITVNTTLFADNNNAAFRYQVTTDIFDNANNLVFTNTQVSLGNAFAAFANPPYGGFSRPFTINWDGIANRGGGAGNRVPAGNYVIQVSYQRVNMAGNPIGGPNGTANPKCAPVTVIATRDISSPDGIIRVLYGPDSENLTVIENPLVPVKALYSLYGLHTFGTHLVSDIYEIRQQYGAVLKASLSFKHNPAMAGDALRIVRYNPTTRLWDILPGQVADALTHRVLVFVSELSSLYALVSVSDASPPEVANLVIIPSKITFKLIDDATGVNVDGSKIFLDGQDITSQAVFGGQAGTSPISVEIAVSIDFSVQHTLKIVSRDMAGNQTVRDETFQSGLVPVTLVVKPEALKVNPGEMTVYAQLSAGFDAANITELYLDGARAVSFTTAEMNGQEGFTGRTAVVKFLRKDVEAALAQAGQTLDTQFVLTGTVYDPGSNTYLSFKGVDAIQEILQK